MALSLVHANANKLKPQRHSLQFKLGFVGLRVHAYHCMFFGWGTCDMWDIYGLLHMHHRYAHYHTMCISRFEVHYSLVHYADDHNRITLNSLEDHEDCQGEFINACFIDVRDM